MADQVRPRVVVLDHTAQLGGAEIALARLLSAVDRERFEVSVTLFADGPLVAELRGQRTVVGLVVLAQQVATADRSQLLRSPARTARSGVEVARHVRRLASHLRAVDADLVVANSLKAAVIGALAARLSGKPFVWHLHDRVCDDYLPRPVASAMRTLARRGCRHVVVNSEATLACIQPIPSERVTIAYPGLPQDAFGGTLPPRSDGTPVVGMVGRVSPTKGQDVLVRAVARLVGEGRPIRLRIVGNAVFNEAGYERDLHQLARRLGLRDLATFAGWSSDPAGELRALDVFVHASPTPEPFGQVIVEAMAAGTPVVATDAGGAREILAADGGRSPRNDGVVATPFGQLVRPGDADALANAIGWALDHPEESRAQAHAAQQSARRRFTIEGTARAVEGAWTSVLAG